MQKYNQILAYQGKANKHSYLASFLLLQKLLIVAVRGEGEARNVAKPAEMRTTQKESSLMWK